MSAAVTTSAADAMARAKTAATNVLHAASAKVTGNGGAAVAPPPTTAADHATRILASVVHQSPLHSARLSYRPRMPPLLRGCFQVVEGAPTSAESDVDVIRSLFPVLFGQPTVALVPNRGTPVTMGNVLRVGFVLSGGPASGGHNVISGLWDHLMERNMDSKMFGFIDGPSGICTGTYTEVTAELVNAFRNQGGFHMVGSGRTKISTPEQFTAARATVEKLALDGLVVIGGDDSNTNAMLLAENFAANGLKTRVIGCPKTIDGDLVRVARGLRSCFRTEGRGAMGEGALVALCVALTPHGSAVACAVWRGGGRRVGWCGTRLMLSNCWCRYGLLCAMRFVRVCPGEVPTEERARGDVVWL